jgi:hypothetical protein
MASSENIIFFMDPLDPDFAHDKSSSPDFTKILHSLNERNSICVNKHIDYTVNTSKELLVICEYYGMSKELKRNKCNKEEILHVLISFENNLENKEVVVRRRQMWEYINTLKSDKFMKKYVLW